MGLQKHISSELNKYLNEQRSNDEVMVRIGSFVLTQSDLDNKYKSHIQKHFGEYNEDTITEALWTLYDIEKLYKHGGTIYRVVWLRDESEFNHDDLGKHWLANEGDVDNIVSLFTYRDDKKGKPFVIKAYTPPNNVSTPYDYFNNLEENEVLVVNDAILSRVVLTSYTG